MIHSVSSQLDHRGSHGVLVDQLRYEQSDRNRLLAAIRQDRDMTETVKQYDLELRAEQSYHDVQVAQRKREIVLMKQHLHSARYEAGINSSYFCKEIHSRSCSHTRIHKQVESMRGTDACHILDLSRLEQSVHEEIAQFSKVQHGHMLRHVSDWQAKYDQDHRYHNQNLQKLTEARVVRLDRLVALKERRAQEVDLATLTRHEHARIIELEHIRMCELGERSRAAAVLQHTVRWFLSRNSEGYSKQNPASFKRRK
mmetsp:Transcript_19321/g.60777  ORF Transcript_19321/g.60777 Transcript_19321/m.60777 type:complete len:255 (-) Transcript_19321:320-1084(-)